MSDDVGAAIRTFIRDEVLEESPAYELGPFDPLLAGMLDSFGLMQLLSFLSDRFDITIPNREVVRANFGTLDALVAYVERKRVEGVA